MPELLIFKAGKYPQGDWPKERVKKLVDAYSPDTIEAPLVIGHRFYGGSDEYQDAHGWVESLRMDGSGKVFATVTDVTSDVKKKVAEKKLKYMSVEVFENDKIDDKQPPYLRAIALLGRDTPAVGIAKLPSAFSFANGGTLCFANDEEHTTVFTSKVSAEELKTVSFEKEADTKEVIGMDEKNAEVERLRADFAAQNERLAALEKENKSLKDAGKKAESEAFFEKLRDEGKITPAQFETCVSIDCKLEGSDEQKNYRSLFADVKPQVDLSGKHAASKDKAPDARSESAGLTAKIKAFQKEHKIASFKEAAEVLFAENPKLFDEEKGNG